MSRVCAGHMEAFANYNLQGVQDHPKAKSRKQTSMSKKFEAASQFENYSARMCARGLLHRQNYSLSFSSFATNKETPSLQWQRNQSTQRVMPTKTAPLTARTCTCSWKVLAVQKLQKDMNMVHMATRQRHLSLKTTVFACAEENSCINKTTLVHAHPSPPI